MKNLLLTIILLSGYQFVLTQTDSSMQIQKDKRKNYELDVFSSGYQIGGITYIGVENEFRFSKHIGLNTGLGISGYTAGLKFHSCPCRSGPFLNISFKDGGFGNIGTLNAEIGGILVFFDKTEKIGLLGQIGAGKILYLSDAMKEKLTKDSKIQDFIIAFGVGMSWYFR